MTEAFKVYIMNAIDDIFDKYDIEHEADVKQDILSLIREIRLLLANENLKLETQLKAQQVFEKEKISNEIEALQQELEIIRKQQAICKAEKVDLEEKCNRLYTRLKELGNRERKLLPKKERSGYILLFSQQRDEKKYSYCDASPAIDLVWVTTYQTPYSVTIKYGDVCERIEFDVRNLLNDIGEPCEIDKYRLTANGRTGFWEVKIQTAHPILISDDNLAE